MGSSPRDVRCDDKGSELTGQHLHLRRGSAAMARGCDGRSAAVAKGCSALKNGDLKSVAGFHANVVLIEVAASPSTRLETCLSFGSGRNKNPCRMKNAVSLGARRSVATRAIYAVQLRTTAYHSARRATRTLRASHRRVSRRYRSLLCALRSGNATMMAARRPLGALTNAQPAACLPCDASR